MKRWQIYSSLGLNVALAISLVASLIPEEPKLADLSKNTQQDLAKALEVRSGMSSENIRKIMGEPAVREFSETHEEWHYCKTGHLVDEYVVFTLNKDKVTALNNYTVSWLDVVYHHTQTPTEALIEVGGMGDCKLTAKWGSYNQLLLTNTVSRTGFSAALKN